MVAEVTAWLFIIITYLCAVPPSLVHAKPSWHTENNSYVSSYLFTVQGQRKELLCQEKKMSCLIFVVLTLVVDFFSFTKIFIFLLYIFVMQSAMLVLLCGSVILVEDASLSFLPTPTQ